jgi:hypothetical protein
VSGKCTDGMTVSADQLTLGDLGQSLWTFLAELT